MPIFCTLKLLYFKNCTNSTNCTLTFNTVTLNCVRRSCFEEDLLLLDGPFFLAILNYRYLQNKSYTKNKKKNHKKAIQASNTKYRKSKIQLNNKIKQNDKQENVEGPYIRIPFANVRYLSLCSKKMLVIKSSVLLFISMVFFKVSFGVLKKLLITELF